MSGGHFDYQQYKINEIADQIEREINRQGREKDPGELWMDDKYYEKYPHEKFHVKYSDEVNLVLNEAVHQLKRAAIFAQRVDWFLSGDDGDESLIRRLAEDLAKLPKSI